MTPPALQNYKKTNDTDVENADMVACDVMNYL